jgi:peptidoglycan/LPS O-acetylase OafA/YrhL
MRICLGLIVLSVFARVASLAAGGSDIAAEVLTPLRMDGLALGSWVALAARGPDGLTRLAAWARPTLLIAGVLAVTSVLLDRRLLGLPNLMWAMTFAALLILIIAATKHGWLGRFGHSSALHFFGKYSYAMYVFQLPLIYVIAPAITASGLALTLGHAWLGQLAYCGLLFAITTAAALVSWHCFEKHVLALKHRFEEVSSSKFQVSS